MKSTILWLYGGGATLALAAAFCCETGLHRDLAALEEAEPRVLACSALVLVLIWTFVLVLRRVTR